MGALRRDVAGGDARGMDLAGWLASQQPSHRLVPEVPLELLESIFTNLSDDDLQLTLQHGLVPIAWLPYRVFYAQCEGFARQSHFHVVAKIDPSVFDDAFKNAFSQCLAKASAYNLALKLPVFSAHRRMTLLQTAILVTFALCIAASGMLMPTTFNHHLFGVSFSIFFSLIIGLRILALNEPEANSNYGPERDDDKLPVYSVLVPLFGEVAVLPQLVLALNSLHYPQEKLDIKLVIEEKDIAMQRALSALQLPEHFQVLVVPSGRLQTKPRALNYALNFARGCMITIYDAEDIPEPMQLRKAARAFAVLPETVACLQAELSFYNPNENWLTRHFTIEYATLFKLILPGLAANRLPLPLGGTSNHFRRQALEAAGGWDAHNVTEDADLGFRLARLGYLTATLDSTTYEEANTKLPNWLQQRARWFKGFLQTWLVHMRRPWMLIKEVGLSGFMIMQATLLGVVFSAALYPLFLVSTSLQLLQAYARHDPLPLTLSNMAESLYIGLFAVGMGIMMFSGAIAARRKHMSQWWLTLATLPIYWLLASVAAWLALWQFITNPFYWNKTRHGLSRFTPQFTTDPISISSVPVATVKEPQRR